MIAFVILHYQALDETLACVSDIKDNICEEKKIVIVDNASPNGSGKSIQNHYQDDSEVEVILENTNRGFAKGNNVGYKVAKKNNPQFIVVLNNDVHIIQKNFVSQIQTIYMRTDFDVLGPDIYSIKAKIHQNPQRIQNYTLMELRKQKKKLYFKNTHKYLLKIKYWLQRKPNESGIQEYDHSHEQEGVVLHGACYIFSERFIKAHDICFYEGTFMYYESYILHYLGIQEGLKFIYSPEIEVLHSEDVSTNKTFDTAYKKSLFSNKCLAESCDIFIKLIEKDKRK